jgi:hypothetical protein
MKTYNGIELLQAIKNGEIKSGTNIEVHDLSVLDKLVTTISVNSDRGLAWETGKFDTSFLLNDYYYFKITNIDIQEIEELNATSYDRHFYGEDKEYYHNLTRETLNEAIRAIKQLDRQINNN